MAATFYRRNKRERDKETPQGILGLGIRKRRTLAQRDGAGRLGFEKASLCTYVFEKTEPGEYIIRVETLDNSSDFENFMEELGAESVGRCFRWGYFRRSAEQGPFDMFSDMDSRIAHLNKIGKDVKLLCLANLVIGICNTFNGASFSWMNLLCATLLAYGLGRIRGKQDTLEEERALHE